MWVRIVAILLALGSVLGAQQGPFVPIPAEQILLQVDAPASPTITANYVGEAGTNTFWYWVIASYPGGVSPIGNPAVVSGAGALSATNTVALGWNRPQGAQTFAVVRTLTPNLNSCTNCLLIAATTGLSFTDIGSNIGNFTATNPLTRSQATITINNRDRANPFLTISGSPGSTFRQVPLIQGSFTAGNVPEFDANGNLVDSGATVGTIGTGAPNDAVKYTGANTVGPVNTGNVTWVGNVLSGPSGWGLGVGGTQSVSLSSVSLRNLVNIDGFYLRFGGPGVTTPAYAFEGDRNTGLYRIGDDNIGLSLGGVSTIEWGSSGITQRVWDQTPTTGDTLDVVRAGAGETGNLTEWQDNSGGLMAAINATGALIQVPSAAQAITGAGDTISCNAGTVQINPDGAHTLTSTPTIADGVDGQVCRIVNVGVGAVTVQDEDALAGSNIELFGNAASLAIGVDDLVEFQFNSALSAWIQSGG